MEEHEMTKPLDLGNTSHDFSVALTILGTEIQATQHEPTEENQWYFDKAIKIDFTHWVLSHEFAENGLKLCFPDVRIYLIHNPST